MNDVSSEGEGGGSKLAGLCKPSGTLYSSPWVVSVKAIKDKSPHYPYVPPAQRPRTDLKKKVLT